MALYAIGDLHLPLGAPDKSMEVFSGRWMGYVEKIRKGFSMLTDEDVCIICGDFCWAMDLERALPDFRFLHSLPGKKILLKGNHDYWWTTASKMNSFLEKYELNSISILHNNYFRWGDLSICGTRGWFFEEERGGAHDEKIMKREIGRLEMSLQTAGEREKLVFLHYPPVFQNYRCEGILELLEKYSVSECCSHDLRDHP